MKNSSIQFKRKRSGNLVWDGSRILDPTFQRITRTTYLTDQEAKKYNKIREQVEKDLPDLISQYHARQASRNPARSVPHQKPTRRDVNPYSLASLPRQPGYD